MQFGAPAHLGLVLVLSPQVPPVSSEHPALVAHAMGLRLFMLVKFHNPKALEAFGIMLVR